MRQEPETQVHCRFCKHELKVTFVDLGLSPVSNAFVTKENLSRSESFFPLHARACNHCFLVQVDDVESAEHHFNDQYAYFSSFSTSWVKHAENYVDKMVGNYGIGPQSHVIEIASNDGYLLQHFVRRKISCLGIEPSANVAKEAEKKGVKSWVKFFGVETAKQLRAENLGADLLLGNNVVAHVPDINDFVGGLKIALKPDGLITLEFPHLLRLIEENQFDTIYHEHFSYFSLHTLSKIFAAHELAIFDVEEIPTHGGSLRIFARHANHPQSTRTANLQKVLSDENKAGLLSVERYTQFSDRVSKVKYDFLEFLIQQKRLGKTIAAYGAPAKGNTFLNYCGVKPDMIEYTVDRSDFKQGRFLPGTRIPIRAPEEIYRTKPDFVVLLPWNLREEVFAQMAEMKSWGGRFVTAIPELRVWS